MGVSIILINFIYETLLRATGGYRVIPSQTNIIRDCFVALRLAMTQTNEKR